MKPTLKRQCDFPGCGRKHEAKGLCEGHYSQRRAGQSLRPINPDMRGASISERLTAYSEPEANCRVWTGFRNKAGYGRVRWGNRVWYVHRVAYTLEHGPTPENMVINHVCGNPACINIAHLELVTIRENSQYRTRLAKQNTSGYRGVHLMKNTGRYMARVQAGGTRHYLGIFDTAEQAAQAAAEGRARLHSMPEFSDRVIAIKRPG